MQNSILDLSKFKGLETDLIPKDALFSSQRGLSIQSYQSDNGWDYSISTSKRGSLLYSFAIAGHRTKDNIFIVSNLASMASIQLVSTEKRATKKNIIAQHIQAIKQFSMMADSGDLLRERVIVEVDLLLKSNFHGISFEYLKKEDVLTVFHNGGPSENQILLLLKPHLVSDTITSEDEFLTMAGYGEERAKVSVINVIDTSVADCGEFDLGRVNEYAQVRKKVPAYRQNIT